MDIERERDKGNRGIERMRSKYRHKKGQRVGRGWEERK